MRAFGAEIILTPQKGGMEGARDLAEKMVREGKGMMLDQFANPDNPLRALRDHRPGDLARHRAARSRTSSRSMGTTGTIMGCSRFLKEKNPKIQIIGCQPDGGLADPGHPQVARGLPAEDLRRARASTASSRVSQADAEEMTRRLAREEGIFAGISSGGAVHVALRCREGAEERGDRHDRLRPRRPLPVHRRVSRTERDARSSLRHRDVPDCRRASGRLHDLPADLPDARRRRAGVPEAPRADAATTSCRRTCTAWW